MTYAQMLDVPFVYSSNGDAFYEHDFLTGMESKFHWINFLLMMNWWHDIRQKRTPARVLLRMKWQ